MRPIQRRYRLEWTGGMQWCSGKFGNVGMLGSPLPSFPLPSPHLPYLLAIISVIFHRESTYHRLCISLQAYRYLGERYTVSPFPLVWYHLGERCSPAFPFDYTTGGVTMDRTSHRRCVMGVTGHIKHIAAYRPIISELANLLPYAAAPLREAIIFYRHSETISCPYRLHYREDDNIDVSETMSFIFNTHWLHSTDAHQLRRQKFRCCGTAPG